MIINGDAIKFPLANNSVDIIVTSPPYNVKRDYGDGQIDDGRDYEEYLDWMDVIWKECNRVLVDGGRLCININDTGRNPYFPVHADVLSRLRVAGWYLMGNIIWDKMTSMGTTSWGSWEMASAPSLRGRHEYIIIAGKGGKKKAPRLAGAQSGPYLNTTEGKEFLSLTNELWRFTPETKRDHPAPFPYELPSRLIRLFSFVGDVILDPFSGSGTTIKAAQDFGRLGIGIDLVWDYCKLSQRRESQLKLGGSFL